MRGLLYAFTPLAVAWGVASAFSWGTTPNRRGAMARRWRSLRAPQWPEDADIVDLSRASAARLAGLRVGSLVRGLAYVLIAAAVLYSVPLPIAVVMLAGAIWLTNHWPQAANLTFLALTNDLTVAFAQGAWQYAFPGFRGGARTPLARRALPTALSVSGVAMLLTAGLPSFYDSETLPLPIPGVKIEHSGLTQAQLGLLLFVSGMALCAAGTYVDRRFRRAEMRQATDLRAESSDGEPPIVFLRPFNTDRLKVPAHPSGRRDGLTMLVPQKSEYLEDVATWLLWSAAPVVAVADPAATRTATLGAAHHAAGLGESWKQTVRALLDRAAAIVIVPGATAGVRWEVDAILKTPAYAAKALLLNGQPGEDSAFLSIVRADTTQVSRVRAQGLVAVAAVTGPGRPQLLCSCLAEDVDLESAVEWFMRRKTAQGRRLAQVMEVRRGD